VIKSVPGQVILDSSEHTSSSSWEAMSSESTLSSSSQVDTTGMATIPSGCFWMGTVVYPIGVQYVCLTGFHMDRFEVTQGQYEAVVGSNPSDFDGCGANCPVENVTWYEADSYCKSIGKRLPTEAEWEYAVRAGTTTRFYWGHDRYYYEAKTYAWSTANSGAMTHPVGQKLPNAWGLYDMSGNVWEWVSDWDGEYVDSAQQDPQGPESGTLKVTRGGGYNDHSTMQFSTERGIGFLDERSNGLGFRCVKP
jgi:formylglycine-generating enzyme